MFKIYFLGVGIFGTVSGKCEKIAWLEIQDTEVAAIKNTEIQDMNTDGDSDYDTNNDISHSSILTCL